MEAQHDPQTCSNHHQCGHYGWKLSWTNSSDVLKGVANGPLPGGSCDDIYPHGSKCRGFPQLASTVFPNDTLLTAPPEWDVMCEQGGRRRYLPALPAGASKSAQWFAGCECPDGRNGLHCTSCAANHGCDEGEMCSPPTLSGKGMTLTCNFTDAHPSMVKGLLQGFTCARRLQPP